MTRHILISFVTFFSVVKLLVFAWTNFIVVVQVSLLCKHLAEFCFSVFISCMCVYVCSRISFCRLHLATI